MNNLYNVAKPIIESSFGQLIIQSGRISSGTALRLAALSLVGIALIKTADTTTRILNKTPYVGFIAEYINPALLVSRLNRKTDELCNKGALILDRKLKWNNITDQNQELALEHIENQFFKPNTEIKAGKDSSDKNIRANVDLDVDSIRRISMVSSIFKSVIAVTFAAIASLPLLRVAESISPGIDSWNSAAFALNIPVRATII